MLEFLVNNNARSEGLRSRKLGWRHSGFSAHNEVRVPAEDAEGRKIKKKEKELVVLGAWCLVGGKEGGSYWPHVNYWTLPGLGTGWGLTRD